MNFKLNREKMKIAKRILLTIIGAILIIPLGISMTLFALTYATLTTTEAMLHWKFINWLDQALIGWNLMDDSVYKFMKRIKDKDHS